MVNEYVQVKVRKDILELFKDLYKMPEDTKYKEIYLYAIASSLPPKGRELFINDYNLDSSVFDQIAKTRFKITKEDIDPKLNNIDKKLDKLVNDKEEVKQVQDENISVIIEYLKLVLFDSAFSTPPEKLKDILNNEKLKSVEQEVHNIVRGKDNV